MDKIKAILVNKETNRANVYSCKSEISKELGISLFILEKWIKQNKKETDIYLLYFDINECVNKKLRRYRQFLSPSINYFLSGNQTIIKQKTPVICLQGFKFNQSIKYKKTNVFILVLFPNVAHILKCFPTWINVASVIWFFAANVYILHF